MKKRFLTILLCFCLILLSGCSVPPQYGITQNNDGSVTQSLYIPFSATELNNNGVDIATCLVLSNKIKEVFDSNYLNMYDNFIVRVNTDEGLSAQDKIALIQGCPTREQLKGEGQLNGISYEFSFASAIHYYYFNYGMYYNDLIAELNKDDSIVENSFFTNKIISKGQTIFGQNAEFDEYNSFAEYITNRCSEILKLNTDLSDEIIQTIVPTTYIYRYGTTSRRLHSDADLVRFVNGIYYHEWNITLENSTREISTWRITANANVWYALALLCGIILTVVLILVCVFKEKKKRPQIEIIEPK